MSGRHVFSDTEGLRIAVEIEKRGEDFYTRAAKVSRNVETVALLNALAGDEVAHRREFQRLYDRSLSEGRTQVYDDETNAYLSAIAADVVFPSGLMGLRETGFDDAIGVLKSAIQSEKDSILFYHELSVFAPDERSAEVFTEIARQERGHLARLMDMLEKLI